MRAIVIGAGVVGAATAYELQEAGVETILIEQRDRPAQETSFANAGSVTASRAGPWASPRAIAKTLKGYAKRDSPVRLRLSVEGRQLGWLSGFVRAAYSDRRLARRRAMIELGMESQRRWHALSEKLHLEYGPVRRGLLTIYDSQKDFELASADLSFLRSLGLEVERLSAQECRSVEPAASWDGSRVVGAILARGDESADCRRFTEALVGHLARSGMEIRLGTPVKGIAARDGSGCRVITATGELRADCVVVAAGNGTPALVGPLGARMPTYPVKGYSITVAHPAEVQPAVTIADEGPKVFVAPCEEGLRAAGVADIVGEDRTLDAERIGTLRRTVARLYPKAKLDGEMNAWTGLRDMTWDGPPVICAVRDTGVWINAGHGSLGWTFACGAASLVAAGIVGRPATMDMRFFGLQER